MQSVTGPKHSAQRLHAVPCCPGYGGERLAGGVGWLLRLPVRKLCICPKILLLKTINKMIISYFMCSLSLEYTNHSVFTVPQNDQNRVFGGDLLEWPKIKKLSKVHITFAQKSNLCFVLRKQCPASRKSLHSRNRYTGLVFGRLKNPFNSSWERRPEGGHFVCISCKDRKVF